MAMKPVVNRLEEEYAGRVEFRALNIDEAQNDDDKVTYRFVGQPQFVVVGKDGQVVVSRNGMQRYETLKADIEQALASQ
jgi:thiol-disulfide isomerase/thioredoxin